MKRNVNLLYLLTFFHALVPAYVIERLFWQERGMNIQMVVYCEFIYAAVVILCELPSGILADIIGRKRLILIAEIGCILEFVILLFANSFWHFALVVAISGIGKACESGAESAIIYESLTATGEESKFEMVLGRLHAIDFGASLIAALCGGFLAGRFGFEFNYILSIGSAVMALPFALMLKEPAGRMAKEARPKVRDILSTAFGFFKKHKSVLVIISHAMLIAAAVVYVDEFWQIYFEDIGFPVAFFGVISAVIMFVRIPGSMIAAVLLKRLKSDTVMMLASLLAVLGVIEAAAVQNVFGLAGIAMICFAADVMEPVAAGYVHKRADSSARATIGSVSSVLERIFTIVIGLIFGFISTKYTIFSGFWSLGILCFAVLTAFALFYAAIRRKKIS